MANASLTARINELAVVKRAWAALDDAEIKANEAATWIEFLTLGESAIELMLAITTGACPQHCADQLGRVTKHHVRMAVLQADLGALMDARAERLIRRPSNCSTPPWPDDQLRADQLHEVARAMSVVVDGINDSLGCDLHCPGDPPRGGASPRVGSPGPNPSTCTCR